MVSLVPIRFTGKLESKNRKNPLMFYHVKKCKPNTKNDIILSICVFKVMICGKDRSKTATDTLFQRHHNGATLYSISLHRVKDITSSLEEIEKDEKL